MYGGSKNKGGGGSSVRSLEVLFTAIMSSMISDGMTLKAEGSNLSEIFEISWDASGEYFKPAGDGWSSWSGL